MPLLLPLLVVVLAAVLQVLSVQQNFPAAHSFVELLLAHLHAADRAAVSLVVHEVVEEELPLLPLLPLLLPVSAVPKHSDDAALHFSPSRHVVPAPGPGEQL